MKNDLKKFARLVFKFLTDKPKSKWSAFAHVWDRGMVTVGGLILGVTAFMTNQAGILLLIISLGAFVFFGLWLVSKGR